ncbi:hypothetical protein [Skermanella pratensis]|uniref:hypothetical protein n=1 Tax=Skermanella pratensis TaxID=2233999 RepID=UPI0013011893|nr:hypothetical protein [Skermanella pratensis]
MRSFAKSLVLTTALLSPALFATAVVTTPSPAFSQAVPAPQDVEIEGEIEAFETVNGVNRMKIMGVWVNLKSSTLITSISGDISPTDLMDPKPIPGFRKGPGFIGGTGIVTGTSVAGPPDAAGNPTGIVTADTIFADTAENVLLGTVRKNINNAKDRWFDIEGSKVILLPSSETANSYPAYPKPNGVYENGSTIHPLYDSRYKGSPIMNAYGFRIKPVSILPGTLVAAEGHYGWVNNQKVFLAFTIEADAGELVNFTTPAVSIQRAQCRQRNANSIDLEVRGSIHNPSAINGAAGTVNIFKPALNGVARAEYGVATAIADVETFGVYDYDARITTTLGCPPKVRAQYTVNGQTVAAPLTDVEIRID